MGKKHGRGKLGGVLQKETPVIGDSDVEEGDVVAYARSQLKQGEQILGERDDGTVTGADEVESRGVCNTPNILQKLADIEYQVPEGAKRIPWVDTLVIDSEENLPKEVKVKDGVKLENAFQEMALKSVREAYRRLRIMKVPASRPHDFYAEMMRSDKQMYKVRARAAEEDRRIKIVEERKQSTMAKKFAKKAKVAKIEARQKEKQKSLDDIKMWQARNKAENNADDEDLETILANNEKNKRKLEDDKPQRTKMSEKSQKRKNKDAKYGFGGKKRFKKQNDLKSLDEMPKKRGGKGKGKGKGKGVSAKKQRRR